MFKRLGWLLGLVESIMDVYAATAMIKEHHYYRIEQNKALYVYHEVKK